MPEDDRKVRFENLGELYFFRFDPVHYQWHGFSFNHHLTSLDQWRSVSPFLKLKRAEHFSSRLKPGAYHPLFG
jgi:hypothetical protein